LLHHPFLSNTKDSLFVHLPSFVRGESITLDEAAFARPVEGQPSTGFARRVGTLAEQLSAVSTPDIPESFEAEQLDELLGLQSGSIDQFGSSERGL
jgi:hypothetical protein